MRVSVCIPTYNQSAFIEKAIRSAVNQTLQPFEIIVYDDCSTDITAEIVSKLLPEISILKFFSQPINLGIAKNVDCCLRQATGDYIVRLDSDDLLYPEYIEKLSALLNKFPDAGYAHAAVNEIDLNGNFRKERKLMRSTGYLDADSALKASVKGYRVAANIIMFRNSALKNVNYITSIVNFAEDYYLSAQLAAKGYGNVYFEEILACYRVWGDDVTVRIKRKNDEISGLILVFEQVIEPAFKKRAWNIKVLEKSRTAFAKSQANCLAWRHFSDVEKLNLKQNILKLSNAWQVKYYIWLYEKGFAEKVNIYLKIKNKLKIFIKNIVLGILKQSK